MSGRALVRWLLLVLVLLSACAAPGVPLRAPASTEAAMAALPLIELPVAGSSRLAIVLSGDGGWSAIDQGIAAELNRQGISVLGWNSLRYFWKEKAPAQVAADLAAAMGHYGQRWQADNIALVGYSFGADMLPFVYPHLPPAQRRQVRFISLLGMAHEADFSVRIGGWLGLKSRRAHALRPLLAGLQPVPVQCIYGIREKDSLCRELQGAITQVVARPGGHHFDGDNAALARIIIGGWEAADSAQP